MLSPMYFLNASTYNFFFCHYKNAMKTISTLEQSIWADLNILSWAVVTHVWPWHKLSFIALEVELCFLHQQSPKVTFNTWSTSQTLELWVGTTMSSSGIQDLHGVQTWTKSCLRFPTTRTDALLGTHRVGDAVVLVLHFRSIAMYSALC